MEIAYTKTHDPWTSEYPITTTVLDNFETIYTEVSSYLSSHVHDDLYQTISEMQAKYWYSGNDGSGSGSDADQIDFDGELLHGSSFSGLGVDTGLIILWYGSVGTIPSGWHLCDGTGGTVNLLNRIPIGAGSAYEPGATGGSSTFTASGSITVNNCTLSIAQMGPHTHPYSYTGPNAVSGTSIGSSSMLTIGDATGTTYAAGGGQGHTHSEAEGTEFNGSPMDSLPFSKALCYIQKIEV